MVNIKKWAVSEGSTQSLDQSFQDLDPILIIGCLLVHGT